MELRKKQRLIGGFVLVGVVLLQLPFLFHSPRPETKTQVDIAIPKAPTPPTVTMSQMTSAPETDAPVPSKTEQPTSDNHAVVFKPLAVKPTVLTNEPETHESKMTPLPQSAPEKAEPSQIVHKNTPVPAQHKPAQHKKEVVKTAQKITHQPIVKHTVKAPEAWVMQVGVFSDTNNANLLMKKLRDNGYETYMRTVKSNGKSMLAVYVGPELKFKKMAEIQQKINQTMHLKGLVKKYEL